MDTKNMCVYIYIYMYIYICMKYKNIKITWSNNDDTGGGYPYLQCSFMTPCDFAR